jgi:hypothetical protein
MFIFSLPIARRDEKSILADLPQSLWQSPGDIAQAARF